MSDLSAEGVNHPISVRGRYAFGEIIGGGFNVLLADNNHIVWFDNARFLVFDRVDRDLDLTVLEETTPLWGYDVDSDPDPPLLIRRTPAFATILGKRCLVYVAWYQDSVDLTYFHRIIARNLSTGDIEWTYDIADAFDAYMVVSDNQILVRHNSQFGFFDAKLLRIPAGATEPVADIDGIEFAYLEMAARGTSVYSVEDEGVASYNISDLTERWRSSESLGESVNDMIVAANGLVYVVETGGRVYCLNTNGTRRWSTQLDMEGDDCFGPMSLASDGDVLIVNAICRERTAALDADTGDILWEQTMEYVEDRTPPFISGNVVYVSALIGDFMVGDGIVRMFDLQTGADLGTLELPGPVPPTFLMATNGLLYVMETDITTELPNSIWVYETEPAALIAGITNRDFFGCGIYENTTIPLEVLVANLGPGLAPNAKLVVEAKGVNVSWQIPQGVSATFSNLSQTFTINLGDMAFQDIEEFLFNLTPNGRGLLEVTATITSDVRNPTPDQRSQSMELVVYRPLHGELDVWIDKVEIAQVLQDTEQSVDLIAQKPTMIRVFARSNHYVEGVNARLRLSGSTLAPTDMFFNEPAVSLNNCLTLDGLNPSRTNLDATFNFLIPPRMLEGRPDGLFSFEVELDPGLDLVTETNRANNTYEGSIEFVQFDPVCLVTYRVHHLRQGGGSVISNNVIPADHIERAKSLLPITGLVQHPRSNILEKLGFFTWEPYSLDPGDDMNTTRLMTTLWTHQKTSSDPSNCLTTHYVGVVDEQNRTTASNGSQFNGIGSVPGIFGSVVGRYMAFRINYDTTNTADFNIPRGGTTLAHEMGHNYSRNHVDCGGPDDPDGNYPYDPCLYGPLTGSVFLGYDLVDPSTPRLIVPTDPALSSAKTSDLMSYATYRWTSDYTWNSIYAVMLMNAGLIEFPFSESYDTALARSWKRRLTGSSGLSLLISGTILDDGSAEFADVQMIGEGVVPAEKELQMAESTRRAMMRSSGYAIELLDDQSTIIATIPVELERFNDEAPAFWLFGTLVPVPDGLAGIRLVNQMNEVLDFVGRSNSAPVVDLLEPTGSTIVDDTLIVDWNATDADSDPLTALIQYSRDDGATWETLVTNVPEPPYVLPADLLAGAIGTARVRLIVSDGFNATTVTSPAFTVLPRGPLVVITDRPRPGYFQFELGGAIALDGMAFDPEDGPLLGVALTWTIDGIGEVGTGTSVLFARPEPGDYLVTLTAEDSDGNFGSDQIVLTIGNDASGWMIE